MDTRQLQELFSAFLQALGLHRPDQVPTGFDLSLSEMFALLALSAEAPMSQQALAEQLHLEKSTVSRLVQHLERRGWVRRVRDLHDTRMFQLQLSEAGHRQTKPLAQSLAGRDHGPLARPPPDPQQAHPHCPSPTVRALSH